MDYVRSLRPSAKHAVAVITFEFVVEHWYENFFHHQDTLRSKSALLRGALGSGDQYFVPHWSSRRSRRGGRRRYQVKTGRRG